MARGNQGRRRTKPGRARGLALPAVCFVLSLGGPLMAVAQDPTSLRPAIEGRYQGIRWVSTDDLATWMNRPPAQRPVLLDVRTEEEFAVSHLRNARRVDPGRPRVGSLRLPPDATVVVYCSVGYRSAAIIEELKGLGFSRVFNLLGGIFQWANENRPLFRGDQRAARVHPYNRFWGLMVNESRRAPTKR